MTLGLGVFDNSPEAALVGWLKPGGIVEKFCLDEKNFLNDERTLSDL
jgi:hypothetical protein